MGRRGSSVSRIGLSDLEGGSSESLAGLVYRFYGFVSIGSIKVLNLKCTLAGSYFTVGEVSLFD